MRKDSTFALFVVVNPPTPFDWHNEVKASWHNVALGGKWRHFDCVCVCVWGRWGLGGRCLGDHVQAPLGY